MSKFAKIPLVLLGTVLGFFVVTFTVYFFNLDMKATSLLAPFLEKWYDRLERKQYICCSEPMCQENAHAVELHTKCTSDTTL